MATNTTNLHLIKPAGSERVQISQINQNMDILDEKIGAVGNTSLQGQITAANSSISSLNSQKGSKSTISSDTEILGYAPGTYMIALSAASDYLPERWGTLVIEKSGVTYGVATFKSTGGNVYVRHMNGANSWHNSWTQLALNSQLDDRIPPKLKIARNPSNATSFEFNIEKSSNSYTYFLLVGGWESTSVFLYLGFISTGNAVTINKIGGSTVPGIAGTYDGSKLTITATNTIYGGMRLIWLS